MADERRRGEGLRPSGRATPAAADGHGLEPRPDRSLPTLLERLQGVELRLQLHDGAGGGRLVEDARLGIFDLLFRRVVEILDVVRVD